MKRCDILFIVISTLIYFFSPLLSFGFSIIAISFINKDFSFKLLLFICVLSIATISASRAYGVAENDDFVNYYNNYSALYDGHLKALFDFGGGLEFIFPLFSYFISLIPYKCTPNQFIFIVSFVGTGLYALALQRILSMNRFLFKNSGLFIAFSFLFYDYFISTQLVRQFFSSIFIILLFTAKGKKELILFFIMSVLSHTTALLIAPFTWLVINKRWGGLVVILSSVFISFFFYYGLEYVGSQFTFFADKAVYYSLDSTTTSSDILSGKLKLILFSLLLTLTTLWLDLIVKKNSDIILKKNAYYLFVYTVIYIILTPIPLASDRFLLILNCFFIGSFIAITVQRYNYIVARAILTILVIWRIDIYSEPGNFLYWNGFESWGYFPGYFLL